MADRDAKRGSAPREAQTCPVCGTKFFATADNGFCPVCILRGATSGESAATGEPGSVSGSADSPGETEAAAQARRFEDYELFLDEAGRPAWRLNSPSYLRAILLFFTVMIILL